MEVEYTMQCSCVCFNAKKRIFFSVFAVIENGSGDFEEPDAEAEGLQVRKLFSGSCSKWTCVF